MESPHAWALGDLARRIGLAAAPSEPTLFGEAASLGLLPAPGQHGSAHCDIAISVFRKLLPDFGFQVGSPPPLEGASGQAFALAWRRGDARAATYEATTPALALLRAAAGEYAKGCDAGTLRACGTCRGLGWYVTAAGERWMCRHAGSGL